MDTSLVINSYEIVGVIGDEELFGEEIGADLMNIHIVIIISKEREKVNKRHNVQRESSFNLKCIQRRR